MPPPPPPQLEIVLGGARGPHRVQREPLHRAVRRGTASSVDGAVDFAESLDAGRPSDEVEVVQVVVREQLRVVAVGHAEFPPRAAPIALRRRKWPR